jgi:hypothetical protein
VSWVVNLTTIGGLPGKARGSLVLSADERDTLLRWTRRAKSSQALAMRARVVLACADGVANTWWLRNLGCLGTWSGSDGPAGRTHPPNTPSITVYQNSTTTDKPNAH